MSEMNSWARVWDEDEATAVTLWDTSLVSRALGSRRRSLTNAFGS